MNTKNNLEQYLSSKYGFEITIEFDELSDYWFLITNYYIPMDRTTLVFESLSEIAIFFNFLNRGDK